MNEHDSHDPEPASDPRSNEQTRESSQIPADESPAFVRTAKNFQDYLAIVTETLSRNGSEIEELCSLVRSAGAVHVFGFGRSGTAALACAIRLRQFCEFLPDVWWVGDQVRMPFRENDLLILFSKDGERGELASVTYQAAQCGAKIVLITASRNSRVGALARLKIILPLSGKPFVYGGGDFELAVFFFQEVLVTHLGESMSVPKECVWRNHV